jgi:hypothetical protein
MQLPSPRGYDPLPAYRPAGPLLASREVEGVQPPEGIGDIEGAGVPVDRRCPCHAVAVDLLADPVELAELDAPTDIAVLGKRIDDALRGREVDRPRSRHRDVLRDERLRADPARDRRVPGGLQRGRRERRAGGRAPGEIVPVDEPAPGRLGRRADTDEKRQKRPCEQDASDSAPRPAHGHMLRDCPPRPIWSRSDLRRFMLGGRFGRRGQ